MSGARKARRGARRAARSEWTERLGRLGFLAKGLVYAVVALIALEVARGEKKKAESEEGAIETLAHQSFGEALLILLAIGLGGYTVWRARVALFGSPTETGGREGMERLGSAVLAVTYGALCWYTVRFLTTERGGGGTKPDELTRNLLDEPWGVAVVIAAGVVMLGVAAYEAHKALTRGFLDDLETGRMSPETKRLATVLAIGGYGALSVISGLAGAFLIKAAVEHDPKEAVGLDGALQELVDQRFGPALLGLVAAGLLTYALYCVVMARYRKL